MDSLLRGVEGVSDVEVDIDKGTATVTYDAGRTGVGEMKKALDTKLFEVTGVEELESGPSH